MSSSGLRGWHRPQVAKPVSLEGQEGKVTSDEERGKTGASKDEGPEPDLLFAGCDLDLLCLTPQTEGSAVLIALHKQLLVQKPLSVQSLFNLPQKGHTKPNFCESGLDKLIPCFSMIPERGCEGWRASQGAEGGDSPRASATLPRGAAGDRAWEPCSERSPFQGGDI